MFYNILFFLFDLLILSYAVKLKSSVVGNEVGQKDFSERYRRSDSPYLRKGGRNVCSFTSAKIAYETKYTVATQLYETEVCCKKFGGCWKKCKRSSVRTVRVSRVISKMVNFQALHCCQGWSVNKRGDECTKPVCIPHCQNNGICVSPDQCSCTQGFRGKLCQLDINECSINKPCQQDCLNLPGTYQCLCKRGYEPNDVQSKSCQSVNECKLKPCRCETGSIDCGATCNDLDGSYECKCKPGYYLSRADVCTDRNECLENPDICPHDCENTIGSYRCKCFDGYKFNGKTCIAKSFCANGNAGCEQECVPYTGGFVCACKDGYYLSANSYQCHDIDECNGFNPCDDVTSRCVNTAGSYYCQCKPGFSYAATTFLCEDRNECTEKTSLCEQSCFNTYGSYKCKCMQGYTLNSDEKTCSDVNECNGGNKCEQVCINTIGSYKCSCKNGYILDVDGVKCLPKPCPKMTNPFFGKVSCDGETIGSMCHVVCNRGFELAGPREIKCLPNGLWSGGKTKCIPKSCDVPKPPPYGRIALPCNLSYGSTCPVTCRKGFVLRGDDMIQCKLINGYLKWDKSNVHCQEILVCKPNPCDNGGNCKIITDTEYKCDCSATGFTGRHCDILQVTISNIPKIDVTNKNTEVQISAATNLPLEILMFQEDPVVTVTPKKLKLHNSLRKGKFRTSSTKTGLFWLTYKTTYERAVSHIPDSLLFFYDSKQMKKFDSLDSVKDCFKLALNHDKCSNIEVSSSAYWESNDEKYFSTKGVVYININGVKFPLTLGKASAYLLNELTMERKDSSDSCSDQLLDNGQLQYVLKYDIFVKQFLRSFNKMMPSWFQVSLNRELKYLTTDNIRARIVTGTQLMNDKNCLGPHIVKENLYLVYKHQEELTFNFQNKLLTKTTSGTYCFIVSLCKNEAHLVLPDDNLNDMKKFLKLNKIMEYGFSSSFKSIGIIDTPENKCGTSLAPRYFILGGATMEFKKPVISGKMNGDIYFDIEKTSAGEEIQTNSQCILGNGIFETPSLKITTDEINEFTRDVTGTHVIKLTLESPTQMIAMLSEESLFEMKSGISPVLQKQKKPLQLQFTYRKENRKKRAVSGYDNFNKINSLMLLQVPIMDLEMTSQMLPSNGLTNAFKKLVSDWNIKMNDDINEIYSKLDDTAFVNSKIAWHYNKALSVSSHLKNVIANMKSISPGNSNIASLERSANDLRVVLPDLKKFVTDSKPKFIFTHPVIAFDADFCLYKPCISNTNIKLYPMRYDIGLKGFCTDLNKGPLEKWQVVIDNASKDVNSIFTFDKSKSSHACLSREGVDKAYFNGKTKLIGADISDRFMLDNDLIVLSSNEMKLFKKYDFLVNATLDMRLHKWNLMSAKCHGIEDGKSSFVAALQNELDKQCVQTDQKIASRVKNSEQSLIEYQKDITSFDAKITKLNQQIEKSKTNLENAKKSYALSKSEFDKNEAEFRKNRAEIMRLEGLIKTSCKIKSCPYSCIKKPKCTVCQEPYVVNKTVPLCKVTLEDRSYKYLKSAKRVCSHVVEERDFKYTGNCEEPSAEETYAKSVVERLNKKIYEKKELTLEDAYLLESVNKEEGKKLREQIEKRIFFQTLQNKMQNNLLNEDDYRMLESFTNKTFAEKIRRDTKKLHDATVMNEIATKINRSETLTESDYAKLRAIDPQLEKNIKKSEAVNEISEKIQKTGSISDSDLAKLRKIAPEYAKNFTEKLNQQEIQKQMFDTIQKKIANSTLRPEDLAELEKVNPDAAEKLKNALKEQLKQKVGEMEKQLNVVKGSLDQGFNNSEFKSLKNQLDRLGGKTQKYDKKTLEELQKKILSNKATEGSLFEEVIERLDLDYDIMNITGNFADIKDVMNQFFKVLPKFDIPHIFQRSSLGILVGLESVQEWFVSAVKIFKQVVEKCSNFCDASTKYLIETALKSLRIFKGSMCESGWIQKVKIANLNSVCVKLNVVENSLKQFTHTMQDKNSFIEMRILNPLSDLVNIWKNIREDVKKLNEIQWEKNVKINLALKKYETFMQGVDTAFSQALKTKKIAKLFTVTKVINSVKKILNDVNSTVSLVQLEVANNIIVNIVKGLEILPNYVRQNKIDTIVVNKGTKQAILASFTYITSELKNMLANLCEKKSPNDIPSYKSISILIKNSYIQLQSLLDKTKTLLDITTYSRRFGNIAKRLVIEANIIKDQLLPCELRTEKLDSSMNATQNEIFQELKMFLETSKEKKKKTVKDVTENLKNLIGEFKDGISSPIGEYINKMSEMIDNAPDFNIPLILSGSTKTSRLITNSLIDTINNIKMFFEGIAEVLKNCKDCTPEDIFGKENLQEISNKIDKYLKPLHKSARLFSKAAGLSPKGLPLILSSLEEIRTTLQTLSMSGTGFSKEGIENIVDAFNEGIESLNFARDGLENSHYLLQSVKDEHIKIYEKSLSSISNTMKKLFIKSDGVLSNAQKLVQKIDIFTERLYEFKNSAKTSVLKRRYKIVKEGSEILKDISGHFYDTYSFLDSSSNLYSNIDRSSLKQYINNNHIPEIESNIDVFKQSINNIMEVTNKMADLSNVADKSQSQLTVFDIDFGSKLKEIASSVGSRKLVLAKKLKDIGSSIYQKIDSFVQDAAEYFDKTVGSIKTYFNETYERVKQKFEKYSKMVDEISSTLDEIKDKPLSKIGDIKNSADELIESLGDYDLALIMSSNPNVIPRKVDEMKALFTSLGSAMNEIDTILQKCSHCNANNIFGYNYMKSMANKINNFSLNMFTKMQKFSQKIGDSIGEIQDMTKTVKGINSRFKSIYNNGKLSANIFKDISNALTESSNEIGTLKTGAQNVVKILFNKDVDLQVLEATITDVSLQLAGVMNKSYVVGKSAESVYNKALQIKTIFDDIKSTSSNLNGPIEQRIKVTKGLANKVSEMISEFPAILKLSQETLEKAGIDSVWLANFAGKTENLASSIASIMNKTTQVMDAANIAVKGFRNIENEVPRFKSTVKTFVDASWDEKIPAMKNIVAKFSNICNIAIDSSIESANALDMSLARNDLKSAAQTLVGKQRLERYTTLFKDVGTMMTKLQDGPISNIGKLTDSVEDFMDSFDNYDFGKILLENPLSLNDKLLEFKELTNTAGSILQDVNSIINNCKKPPCNTQSVFGNGFVGNMINKFDKKFQEVQQNVSNLVERTGTGLKGLQQVLSTVKSVRKNFKDISNGGDISKKLDDVSNALLKSSQQLSGITAGTKVIFQSIFDSNKDMEHLQNNFEGLVNKVGVVLNKSAVALPKAGKIYESVRKVQGIFKDVSSNIGDLDEGPVEQRLKILKEITGGITNIGKSLTTVFNQSNDLIRTLGIDSTWMNDVSKGMYDVSQGISAVMNKSNIIIEGAGEITKDVRNIESIVGSIKTDYEKIKKAPWEHKFKLFDNAVKKVDNILTVTDELTNKVDGVLKNITGNDFKVHSSLSNVTGALSGVLGSLSKSVKKVSEVHSDITKTIKAIKAGPVQKVGKLVDTTKEFVKSIKNYDLSEILILGPKFVKGRISDLKEMVFESGIILKNISGLVNKHCKICNFDKILGSGFVGNITNHIKDGLGSMTENIEKVMDKVSENSANIVGVVDSVKGIKDQLNRVKNLKFDEQSFETISDVLTNTADHLQIIQSNSTSIFKSLFSENKAMVDLLGKYEGFVNRMNGILVATSNFTKDVSVTVKKFNELKEMFNLGKENLENLTRGPIENRLNAVKGIINVVNSVMTGLPDIIKTSPISNKWLQGLGVQLEGITGSVSNVLNTTLSITNDVGDTIESVRNIQKTVGGISNDIKRLSSGSVGDKINAANDIVNKVKTLTGQINTVANNASNVIERVTGLTLIKTDIFGNTSSNILQQISNGLGTVADRYEKFQELSENIKEAFKSIKDDPIKFALEDLPKLFNQSEKFINLLFKDVSGIAKKIGIDLEGVNLDKKLVESAKAFYGFAQNALKAIQSGASFVSDFKSLLNSKDFKEGLENFQKLAESGTNFLNSIDKLGSSLFENWENMKESFSNALSNVKGSLGINLENMGSYLSKGLQVGGDVLSIYSNLKTLLNLKEFDAATLVKAANSIINIAQAGVSIMNSFGMSVSNAGIEAAQQAIGTIAAVVQLYEGIKGFTEWLNDVCDITYEDVIKTRNLTYLCLKDEEFIETLKIPVETCKPSVKQVERGFKEGKLCCPNSECVYMQSVSCLTEKAYCVEERIRRSKLVTNVEGKMKTIYKDYYESSEILSSNEKDVKIKEILLQKDEMNLQISKSAKELSLQILSKAQDNNIRIKRKLTLVRSITTSTRSLIKVTSVSFDATFSTQELTIVPLKINWNWKSTLGELTIPFDFLSVESSLKSSANSIIREYIDLDKINSRRRRSLSYKQVRLGTSFEWVKKCGAYTSIKETLDEMTMELQTKVKGILPYTNKVSTGTSPSDKQQALANEITAVKQLSTGDIQDIVQAWKRSSVLKLTDSLPEDCNGFLDCIQTQIDKLKSLYQQNIPGYKNIQTYTNNIENIFMNIAKRQSQNKVALLRDLNEINDLLERVKENTYFCDEIPTLTKQMPMVVHAYINEDFELACTISGPAKMVFKWLKNDTIIPNQNLWSLKIEDVSKADQGYYSCIGEIGEIMVTSNKVLVRVFHAPAFKSQPESRIIEYPGAIPITMVCNATSEVNSFYKWWFKDYTSNKAILLTESSILTISRVQQKNVGHYWCQLSDGYRTIESKQITLDITKSIRRNEVARIGFNIEMDEYNLNCDLPESSQAASLIPLFRSLITEKYKKEMIFEFIYTKRSDKAADVACKVTFQRGTSVAKQDSSNAAVLVAQRRQDLKENIQLFIKEVFNETSIKKEWNNCILSITSSKQQVEWQAKDAVCPNGYGISRDNLKCVECTPGTFDNMDGHCVSCPIGTYQPSNKQVNCVPCNHGYLTPKAGTPDRSQCQKINENIEAYRCNKALNLLILLDSSSRVSNKDFIDVQKLLDTIQQTTKSDVTKVSFGTISDTIDMRFTSVKSGLLSNYYKFISYKKSFMSNIKLGSALDFARKFLAQQLSSGEKPVVLTFIKSQIQDGESLIVNSKVEALKDEGIEVYFAPLQQNYETLRRFSKLASRPIAQHLFDIRTSSSIEKWSSVIAKALC